MKKPTVLICCIGFALVSQLFLFVDCFAPNIVCPDSIDVKQELVGSSGIWEAIENEASHRLMSVEIYDGHPRERFALVPDTEPVGDSLLVCSWKFPPGDTTRHWIACSYYQTNIMLVRPLYSSTANCQVTLDLRSTIGGLPSIVGIKIE